METVKTKKIKCIIWDLDNTVWDGVLSENPNVVLKPGIVEIIKELDSRGILNSIASKNNEIDALEKIAAFGLREYFLYPQINWDAKSHNIEKIRNSLNIGMDTILFLDDQPFELDEVQSVHSDIRVMDSLCYATLLQNEDLVPTFITEDSSRRRLMYIEDGLRADEEKSYNGPQESFLATLGMQFIIKEAEIDDLKRAEELTIRTNQLNATGKTYDYDELNEFRISDTHILLICELTDKYGTYGKIGLALIEKCEGFWHLRLMLMSCRVISRGVGTVFLSYIMLEAQKHGVKLRADFRDTGRNRMMNISFRFSNFKEIYNDGDKDFVLEHDCKQVQAFPDYLTVKII